MHPSLEKLLDVQKLDRETRLLEEAKVRRPMELNDEKRKVAAGQETAGGVADEITACRLNIDKGELNINELEGEIQKSKIAMNGPSRTPSTPSSRNRLPRMKRTGGLKRRRSSSYLPCLRSCRVRRLKLKGTLQIWRSPTSAKKQRFLAW